MNRKRTFAASFAALKEVRLFVVFLCLACLSFLFLDRPLATFLHPLFPFYARPVRICSHLISPLYPLLFGFVFLILWLARVKSIRMRPFFEVTAVQFIAGGIVRLLKVIVARARPDVLWLPELKKSPLNHHFHSFPSGHTMAAFALAATLALFYPRCSLLFFGAAFCLSLSRVLLLDHYLSDLLGTAALAIIIARFVHERLQEIDPTTPSLH
ncbi:MAG: phosphatase PAP2 family protein [Chlamydiota bacterium]